MRRHPVWVLWGGIALILWAGCGRREVPKPLASPAEVAAAPAASPAAASPAEVAAAPAAETAVRAAHEAPKQEEAPLWPDPLPPGWKVLNDYEAPLESRKTLWSSFFDTWSFRGGKCRLSQVDEGGSRRLQVEFSLPLANSQCGTFEYLAGEKGKPRPVDIRPYEAVVFLLKSGDGEDHQVRLEVTELDPYDAALQGYTGESRPLLAGKEWKRYEVRLDDILHPMFNRKMGRQVGVRLDRKDQERASGVVLLDNVTFVEKSAP